MLTTLLVPPELQKATERLSLARRAAVLAARAAWIDGGLPLGRATSLATRYAGRLRGKQLGKVRREVAAVSRLAARHESQFLRAFKGAVGQAQQSLTVLQIEVALAHGSIAWEKLEPMVQQLGDNLA